jgi:hypothetical protein
MPGDFTPTPPSPIEGRESVGSTHRSMSSPCQPLMEEELDVGFPSTAEAQPGAYEAEVAYGLTPLEFLRP